MADFLEHPKVFSLEETMTHLTLRVQNSQGKVMPPVVDLLQILPHDQSVTSFSCILMTTPRQHVKGVTATNSLCQQFRREDFFFTPNHAILQGCVNIVLGMKTLVNDLDIVNEADKKIRFKLFHLIKIKRWE